MCEDKSGDKTVIPAKTVSSVQGSEEKIKAVCCGCVCPLRKGVVPWIISIKRIWKRVLSPLKYRGTVILTRSSMSSNAKYLSAFIHVVNNNRFFLATGWNCKLIRCQLPWNTFSSYGETLCSPVSLFVIFKQVAYNVFDQLFHKKLHASPKVTLKLSDMTVNRNSEVVDQTDPQSAELILDFCIAEGNCRFMWLF